MPFSKITGGLIFQDNLSAADGWAWVSANLAGFTYGYGIQPYGPPQNPTSITTQSVDEGGSGAGESWYQQLIDVGAGLGRQVHIYVQANTVDLGWARGFETPLLTLFQLNTYQTNGFIHAYAEISDVGVVLVKIAHSYASGTSGVASTECWVSHLVICSSNFLTLTGFAAGQRVEVYQQGTPSPVLVAEATVPANSTEVVIDFSNIFFPYQYFFKVYTSKSTLLETTPILTLSGGDTWAWTAPVSGLIATASNFVIYQIGGVNPGLPQNAAINAALNDQNGRPYSGATIQFATDLGVLSSPSALTDLNGRASVTLSSTKAGIAVVTVKWGGDPNNPTVPAATGFVPIHIWSTIETPDPTQPFQFFCEGREYTFADGTYTLAANEVVGNFEVDLPVWQPSLTLLGLCSFYRFGVKEFSGVLTRVERRLSDSPTVKLIGVDVSWLLNARVVSQAQYAGSPASVLAALLTNYEAGLSPGDFTLPSAAIAVDFSNVQLLAAVNQVLATVTGSQWRVNADLTLDASNTFGNISDADFVEANTIASSSSLTEDLTLVSNKMHVSGGGKPPIRSLAADPASIAAYGLLEGTDLQPSVTDQATLDLVAAYDAAKNGFAGELIQLSVLDMFPSGTYALYDYVTVTSPTLGLAGFYQVMQFTRTTLRNPYATQLQLGARAPELWQMDEPGKRITAQLGGLVTPIAGPSVAVDSFASGTGSANLTHSANVIIIIFTGAPGPVTVGGAAATQVVHSSGLYFDAYSITRQAAGTELVSVGSGYDFIAVSIKNSTTNVVDSAAGGQAEQSPITSSQVTINAGTPNRLVLVFCAIYVGGTSITLDAQLAKVTSFSGGTGFSLSAGGLVDAVGDALGFNNSGDTGSAGWIASVAVAIKP